MGIIQRQGIKQSLVNYTGVLIAAFSTIFIYSLDTEAYGFARFVIDSSFFLMPFILLGASSVAIKFFPTFKDSDKDHNGFLGFLSLQGIFGCIFILGVLYIFEDILLDKYSNIPSTYKEQLHKIGILSTLVSIFYLSYNYTSNFKRIVVPSILQNLIKISLPILILLYVGETISLNFLANGIIFTYLVALIGIYLYLYFLGQLNLRPNFSFIDKSLFKQITLFATFSVFSGIGGVLAFKIDSMMVPALIDLKNNGVYGIAAFIGNAIAIPTTAIITISAPMISDYLNKDDLESVNFLYKRSSINLLVFGMLLFVLIACSVKDLFRLMPGDDFDITNGYYVVLLLGLAKIIDMATSVNSQIIHYSKFYKFNLIAILLLAIINVVLNLILIPKFQIIGAAMATLISLTLFNLVKLIFIQIKFNMHPFSMPTIYTFGIAGFSYIIASLIPSSPYPLLNIILNSIVVALIYIPLVLYFNLSDEVNKLWSDSILKIRSIF